MMTSNMKAHYEIIGLLEENREAIKSFGVSQIGVFGSYARGEQTLQSDVDVLVELENETFDAYMGLLFYLENLFGKKVDLVMKDTIKPLIKNRILKETVYAEGL